jgi:dTDP-4-dehydrorhamnose 3,5-epimerase-like enzyme
MDWPDIRFTTLDDFGDNRGSSFSAGTAWLSFLGALDDAHITNVLPGFVRGNHYHSRRREVLIVLFTDNWRLNWDNGEATLIKSRQFHGAGAVIVEIDPLSSHAVANTGKSLLWIIGLSNAAWNAQSPDAGHRQVFPIP